MDFIKVLDQTVREIKREVNLKVLKVPEIEQKVLDATSNEPWGPHGSALAEISHATKKFSECQMIMNVLWTRLTDTGPNWRHVYKALTVIEYLVANGSERAVGDILEHSFQISSLSGFEYVEPNGKDVGINVRKKVEAILALLNDQEKIQAVRNKAAANRDKYFGLSSSGITYKSGSTSYGGGSFQHNAGYGSLGHVEEDKTFKDSHRDGDRNGDERDWNSGSKDVHVKSQERRAKGTTRPRRDSEQPNGAKSAKHDPPPAPNSSNTQSKTNSDDFDPRGSSTFNFDDFDPRGSSSSVGPAKTQGVWGIGKPHFTVSSPAGWNTTSTFQESVATTVKQVDPFGDSLIDLTDAPTATTEAISNTGSAHEVDLFEDAAFVSAIPQGETSIGSYMQGQLDLFADQPPISATFSNVDLFCKPDSGTTTKTESPVSRNTSTFDPFSAIPLSTSESSDLFGAFTSHSDSASAAPWQNSGNDKLDDLNQSAPISSKPAPMKDNFRVKPGIWADSLSRGLVDLNLTAPKKVSLSDVGVVGGLSGGSDETEKRPPASMYMGRPMGAGSGLGKSGFT